MSGGREKRTSSCQPNPAAASSVETTDSRIRQGVRDFNVRCRQFNDNLLDEHAGPRTPVRALAELGSVVVSTWPVAVPVPGLLRLGLFRLLHHERLRGQDERSDRCRILQR